MRANAGGGGATSSGGTGRRPAKKHPFLGDVTAAIAKTTRHPVHHTPTPRPSGPSGTGRPHPRTPYGPPAPPRRSPSKTIAHTLAEISHDPKFRRGEHAAAKANAAAVARAANTVARGAVHVTHNHGTDPVKPHLGLFDRLTNEGAKGLKVAGDKVDPTTSIRNALASAGVKTPNLPTLGDIASTLGPSALNVARATAEDPNVAVKTVKGVPALAEGSVAGIAELGLHPKSILDLPATEAKDFHRRYGNLKSDPAAFRARIKKEGALSELSDIAAIAAPEGAIADRGIATAARTGVLGKRAAGFVTKARPALRVRAGDGGAEAQDLGKGISNIVRQRALDKARAHKTARQAATADNSPEHGIRGLVPGKGEVVRLSKRQERKGLRSDVAHTQGRAQLKIRRLQAPEVKGARQNIKSLNRKERRALKLAIQIGLPADSKHAAAVLREHRANIVAARKATGKVPASKRNDTLDTIDAILADPAGHLTPKLRKVADEERARAARAVKQDPSVTADTAKSRALADQAQYLLAHKERHGDRGNPLPEAEPHVEEQAKRISVLAQMEMHAQEQAKRAEARVRQAEDRVKQARDDVERAKNATERAAAHANLKDKLKKLQALRDRPGTKGEGEAAQGRIDALKKKAGSAEEPGPSHDRASAQKDSAEKDLGRARAQAGAAKLDESRAKQERQHLQQRVGVRRANGQIDAETPSQYVQRVGEDKITAEARRHGLVEGGYVKGEKRPTNVSSTYATGSGEKAVTGSRRSTGTLFATGRQDANPDVVVRGPASNIKTGVNWNATADTFERHTPEWGRNRTVNQLRDELDRRGLSHNDWVLYDPGKIRAAHEESVHADPDTKEGAIAAQKRLADALDDGTITHTISGASGRFRGTANRVSLVPKEVAEELRSAATPAGAIARTARKVQGASSRVLLNLNPSFVPVQIVSNTPLAALAMQGRVHRLISAQHWYRGLSPQSKSALDDFMGISPSADMGRSIRYGSSADGDKLAEFFKATVDNDKVRAFRAGHGNPMNWNPWLDEKQNHFFRRAVFYDKLRRDSRRQIGDNMRDIIKEARPVMDVLKMPDGPEKVAALRAAEPAFERAAKHTDDMLGDYLNYTARERKYLKTFVMFYGFLRWSVRFAFYTMPVKHPIVSSLAAKLGQLHNEEVIGLLTDQAKQQGLDPKQAEDVLRSGDMNYVFGRVYSKKDGKLVYRDITRANPLNSAVLEGLGDPFGSAGKLAFSSPIAQAAVGAVAGVDLFNGRPLADKNNQPLTGSGKFRYLGGQLANLATPVRVGDAALHNDTPSSDSIPLISHRGVKPGSSPTSAAVAATKRKEHGTVRDQVTRGVVPFAEKPAGSTVRGIQWQAEQDAKRRNVGKPKKKKGGGWGGGSSGGSGWGAGSGSKGSGSSSTSGWSGSGW